MNLEDRVKMLVGDLMVGMQSAKMQIEELQKKVAELEARQNNVEPLHRDRA